MCYGSDPHADRTGCDGFPNFYVLALTPLLIATAPDPGNTSRNAHRVAQFAEMEALVNLRNARAQLNAAEQQVAEQTAQTSRQTFAMRETKLDMALPGEP